MELRFALVCWGVIAPDIKFPRFFDRLFHWFIPEIQEVDAGAVMQRKDGSPAYFSANLVLFFLELDEEADKLLKAS